MRVRGTAVAWRRLVRAIDGRAFGTTTPAMPVLIVRGSRDPFVSGTAAAALATRIPGARFVSIPSAGRSPLEEQPYVVNRAILRFFSEAERTGAGDPRLQSAAGLS
jgi:pimeloyl-ACP methyl ester carboxylesterase